MVFWLAKNLGACHMAGEEEITALAQVLPRFCPGFAQV